MSQIDIPLEGIMSNVKKRKCIQIFLLGLRHCTDFKDRGGDTAQKDCGQMFKLRWGHRTEFKDRGGHRTKG